MTIWLTSDSHFWHANILKYNPNRPYFSVEEMNEGLIFKWNEVVKPEDTIYHLGDFSFAGRSVELYSHRLNGYRKLVPGNHDPIHPYNKHFKQSVKRGDADYWPKFYQNHGWEVLPLTATLDIPGVAVVNLSHMPYDNEDKRYDIYKPKDDGRWLLHGHTHSLVKHRGRMIHVGVDAWDCAPVSVDQVAEIILSNKS